MKIIHLKNTMVYEDGRGKIHDLIYPANITHVGYITSLKNSVRGNHYHKKTTQHIFITKGKMKYWYRDTGSERSEFIIGNINDVITSGPYEVHAMQMLEDTDFMVFAEGVRAGPDYETDTYRVESIIR